MPASNFELLENGPFPSHIDPWAERGRYFHQMHAHMIGYLLDAIQRPMYERGYVVGRESSVQITTSLVNPFSVIPQKKTPIAKPLLN